MGNSRADTIKNGAAKWGAFYRLNPHRFCKDYLHIELHIFQIIVIYMMNVCNIVVFIASRGLGKTFLCAVYCVIRCILYPGTKIVVASGTRGQAGAVLEKIMMELVPRSDELTNEIDHKKTTINGNEPRIVFKNTSYIKVVTASDSARGNRANILVLDEYRLINKGAIDTILKKFLTERRAPEYHKLTKAQRIKEWNKEKNKTMYLSSAYFTDHWSFQKCMDTLESMTKGMKKQFVCGLPYQLSIKEGRLDKEVIEDEMCESDFNEIKFSMEYEALWYGVADGSFFDYNTIAKNRRIKYAMLPDKLAMKLGNNSNIRIKPKENGEIRILSADIALMSSKKNANDATAIFINCMTPTKAGRYVSNIVYSDCFEGVRTDEQALYIRKLFDEYQCDYIVLDCQGVGMGCYDALSNNIFDPETGEIYPALSCCNDKEMADRCTVQGAEKVIWSIKASSALNSDAAFLLREGFKSGRVRLLVSEYEADELMQEIKGYKGLSPADKVKIELPYLNTTLLIDELTKLLHEEVNGKIRIKERSGMRKDRYSSLSYNYYVAVQIENKKNKNRSSDDDDKYFVIKPPKYNNRGVVSALGGKSKGYYL